MKITKNSLLTISLAAIVWSSLPLSLANARFLPTCLDTSSSELDTSSDEIVTRNPVYKMMHLDEENDEIVTLNPLYNFPSNKEELPSKGIMDKVKHAFIKVFNNKSYRDNKTISLYMGDSEDEDLLSSWLNDSSSWSSLTSSGSYRHKSPWELLEDSSKIGGLKAIAQMSMTTEEPQS